MSQTTHGTTAEHEFPKEHYLNADHGWKSWLLTTDHKRICILYLISVSVFFAIGGMYAGMIRLELVTPEGDLFQPDTYNRVFTMHAVMAERCKYHPDNPSRGLQRSKPRD